MNEKPTLDNLRDALTIDPDDLDTCLTQQPDLFYHAADQQAQATSRRDEIKLNLDEATAEIDGRLRKQAVEHDEKITEALLQQRLRIQPRIKELMREFLEARVLADRWQALKESYSQRSFMLRELVQRQIAQLHHLSLERGVASSKAALGDAAHERIANSRKERYGR
jgi:hypothetical protein